MGIHKLRENDIVTVSVTDDVGAFSYVTHGMRVGIAQTNAKAGELLAVDFDGTYSVPSDTDKTYAYGDTIRLVDGVAVPDGEDTDPIIGRCVSEKADGVEENIEVALGGVM